MTFVAIAATTSIRIESLSTSGAHGPVVDDVRVSPYPACPGDLNNDAVVNGGDISVLLGFWGQSGKGVLGDINGDGLVDAADLAMLLSSWGKCP
jgi:hypothetical protein